MEGGSSTTVITSFVLFLVATLGGFFLASFHLLKKLPAKSVVIAHASVAVIAFLVLLGTLILQDKVQVIMRHPIHPMLVHFPIACWSMATIADFASLHYGKPAWHLAGTLMIIGIVMALPAMLAGLIELIQVPDDSAIMRDAYLHMGVMMLAFALYVASLMMRIDAMHLIEPGTAAIIVSACGFIILSAGGWLGGRLVYGHGVGGRRQTPLPNERNNSGNTGT